jgi:ribose transport system permease protein
MKSMRVVADLVQAKPPDEVDARTAANRRRQATAIIVVALIALLLVAGLTTPSFLTVENMLVVIRNASVTGVVALGMSYVTISGNLFALSAEELSILSACIFGWLMRASFGLPLSLLITLLFSGAGGAL